MQDRAAIYTRLSKDRSGLSPNCQIQLDEAQDYAEGRGYAVVATFEDNDISASKYSTKPRPDYERLLALIKGGQVDVVLSIEMSRLYRRMEELLQLIKLAETTALKRIETTEGQVYLLSTPEGIFNAIQAVNASMLESGKISARSKRKRRALAKQGLPVGGTRAFGYKQDGMTIIPEEAEILHEIARRIIAGDSLASIVSDLNRRGVRTVRGNLWYRHRLNDTITRKRYVGIRKHLDNEYPAQWPAIFDAETFERIQLELKARSNGRKVIGTARRYLLTGFIHCGLCGAKMSCSTKKRGNDVKHRRQTYQCRKDVGSNQTGCNRISRNGEAIDDLVTEAVLFRLDSEGLASIMANLEQDRGKIAALMRDVETKRLKMNDLDTDYATGLLDRAQYARMSAMAKDAHQDAQEALQRAMSTKTVVNLPVGQRVREAWEKWDLEQRRNVLSLLIERVVVHQQKKCPVYRAADGRSLGRMDPDAIEIRWKN